MEFPFSFKKKQKEESKKGEPSVRPRGFRSHRNELKLKAIHAMGGRAAHKKKNKTERCHEFNSETARAAVNKRWGKC